MLSVRGRLCLFFASVMLAAGAGASAAGVGTLQPPPIFVPGATTTTTTTAPRHVASTTTSMATTSTTRLPATTTTTAGVSPDAGPAPAGSAPPGFVMPSWAAQIIAQTPLSAPNNSGGLVIALRPLVDLGLSPLEAVVLGMGRFPLAGFASWRDDFLDARFGPDGSFHFHGGEDLVSACGTPLRSPTDGTLRIGSDPAGGNTVEVVQPDRTYFYLAHLSAWVLGQATGQAVRTGQVIGFVGQTGSATGCHLHLEIHSLGGAAVDPKPFVDAWVADATARAPALIDHVRRERGLAPLHPAPGAVKPDPTPAPALPDRETFLWASAANPAGGALALAQADAADAVSAAGADQLASGVEAQTVGWIEAQLASAASLASTTPPALRSLLGMGSD